MFNSPDYPKSLEESKFESWLEEGRESKLSYTHLLIIWSELDNEYKPVYVESRDAIKKYEKFGESIGQESLVAAYDLYSESRIE